MVILVGKPGEPEPRVWLPRAERAATKKGIGLTYGHCADAQLVGASWQYGWGPRPKDCPGVESVPMIWGRESIGTEVSGTSNYLLGFNEPDRSNQADLTPAEAAELWRDVELLYADDWLLVSPAVSHTDVDWLRRFVSTYQLRYDEMPQLDALAVHCYANTVQGCIDAVQEVIEMADDWQVLGGVWLTEFAFWPTAGEEVADALTRALHMIGMLDGEPGVVRYAWFAARMRGDEWWAPNVAAPLVEFETGQLTMYGVMYGE